MTNPTVQSQIPFWGQAWELVVYYTDVAGEDQQLTVSTNAWEPEALRITFEVVQSTIPSPWWYADITIYNLNVPTFRNAILRATRVTLKAGFQTGAAYSSLIWDSPVLQVLLDQENVVDTRATLHCVATPSNMAKPTTLTQGAFASQYQLLSFLAQQIGMPPMSFQNNTLSQQAEDKLKATAYLRGNTVFGTYGDYLDIVSNSQFLNTFRSGSKTYMTQFGDGSSIPEPDFIYAPPNPPNTSISTTLPPNTTQTIIGTPRQIPQGVVFTVLLDPRLKVDLPIQVVQIVGTQVAQLPVQVDANSELFAPLTGNLVFFVGQIRHVGDSRGNDWYTEVTGFSTTYGKQLLSGIFSPNS